MARDESWQIHPAGSLLLYFRARSEAAREIDELAAGYSEALATVAERLELDAEALPPIRLYLADLPLADDPAGFPDEAGPGSAFTVWSVHAPETPPDAPEAELARVLLQHALGPATPASCFWDEGLAGYLALHAPGSTYHAEATGRCNRLVADGLLPPIEELAVEAGQRVSAVISTAAAAFADYLIGKHGLARYRELLVAARAEDEPDKPAFERAYSASLTVADRDWRRTLHAAERARLPSSWAVLRKLLPLGRPYWSDGLTILACILITIAFSVSLPLAFRFLIDNILGRRPLDVATPFIGPRGYLIAAGQEQLDSLFKLLGLLGLLYLLNAAARLRLNTKVNQVSQAVVFDLRKQMLEIVARLPVGYFGRVRTADLHQRIVQDTLAVQQIVTRALVPIISAVLSIVLFTVLLLALEPRLTLVASVGLPVLWFVFHLRRRGRQAAAREQVRRTSDLSVLVNELIGAQALVKVYRAAPLVTGRRS